MHLHRNHGRIRRLRRGFGLSQKDLASLLGQKGRGGIGKLENEAATPTLSVLGKLSVIFDKPMEYFRSDLLERAWSEVADHTIAFKEKLLGKKGGKTERKQELVDAIMSRMAVSQHIEKQYDHPVTGPEDTRPGLPDSR
jgi:transcriptional regulator with XRE-family HTH domain